MSYVRKGIAPASSERSRRRAAAYRASLAAPQPEGQRFALAYDWFREALLYALRRSYPALATADQAQARRLAVIAEAAAALHEAGCAVDSMIPKHLARTARRREIHGRYAAAPAAVRETDKPLRLYAAYAWLTYGIAQADRYGRWRNSLEVPSAARRAADETAPKLIELAEEMEADDYGR